MTDQEISFFLHFCQFGTYAPWVVSLTEQLKTVVSCANGLMRDGEHAKYVR